MQIETQSEAAAMPTPSKRKSLQRKAMGRDRVSNGARLLGGDVDERSVFARRFRSLCASHSEDLGGIDTLSEAQISLVRRCAALEITLEQFEMDMAGGVKVDIDVYARTAGHLRRLFETLGMRRIRKLHLRRGYTPTSRSTQTTHRTTDMRQICTARRAFEDEKLLGVGVKKSSSWLPMRSLAIAAMGEELNDEERAHFTKLTGREREPLQRVRRFICVAAEDVKKAKQQQG